MKGRVFLFEWNQEAAGRRAEELRADGWDVETEWEDGARGGAKVRRSSPDVVVLDLAKRPSHSRETADALRSLKATRQIPIVFVDGSDEAIAKTKAKVPGALYTTGAELRAVLQTFAKGR